MIVSVTQKDIDSGVRHSPNTCPVARAIKRRIKDKPVHVYPDVICIDSTCYPTPPKVRYFISTYDVRGGPVKPMRFSFEYS